MSASPDSFEDSLEVRPVAGSLGAEIRGIDLSATLDASTVAALREAFLRHHVLFFRDQTLDPGALAAIGRRFGELNVHPYVAPLDGHPEVFAIIKEADDRHHFGNGWHTDLSYAERPALGTLLYGIEVPAQGGDTLFASLHLAYEALSEGMKTALAPLRIVNSNERTYGPDAKRFKDGVKQMSVSQQQTISRVSHPLVRTHPETGRRSLYLSPIHAVGIEGMGDDEAASILDFLFAHAAKPEFTCRFRWSPGALAFWDNRSTMHYAVDDFSGHRRVMHRVTLEGDVPA